MYIAFINPQGNFDPGDSHWTAHPDFGGQLVYVKQLALGMAALGHHVDIVTRQIVDPAWPEFAAPTDGYPDHPDVRIVRIPCGPPTFLRKEDLWPFLGSEFVPRLLARYAEEGVRLDAVTAHYGDGGLCAALINERIGVPFTFTAHSLGAQKMDKLKVGCRNIAEFDTEYHFSQRIMSERVSMNRSAVNVTSTAQERYSQYTHNAYRGAIDPTDDGRFAVVPPGVAMEIFDRSARYAHEEEVHQRIRENLERDLAHDRLNRPCIVASSRLDPKKNHKALLEAFAGSPVLRESANLVIVTGDLDDPLKEYRGAGPSERAVLDSLMEVIERAQLRGQISMFALRGQGELAAGYRYFAGLHSVFSLTALYEPFGLAPLEAMAAGLPAVVTKFGGPSESLRAGDEDFGILVDPNNPVEVSTGLYALTGDLACWRRYAEAGYTRVVSHFTWTRTAEGYLEALSGERRGVDEPTEELRSAGGTETPAAVEEIASSNGAHPSSLNVRLPIPAYFTDPRPENRISVQDLYDVYLKLDVLAVGETVVDFLSHRAAKSLRTAQEFSRYLGGQPANVAVYVAKLVGRSAVLSAIGTDYFGDFLEDELQHHGVSTESLHHTTVAPTTNVFVTKTTGVPDFQVNRGADALLDIRSVPEELIERAQVIHTSVFALSREPQRSAIRRALRLAYRHGKIVSLDPNYAPRIWPDKDEAWEVIAEIMPSVTIVKPSLEDARRLFDYNMSDDELEATCLREFHDLGAKVVIVTRSGGNVTVSDGGKVERVGPLPMVPVENVTGGRDAFWSALLIAHLDGKSWPFCIRFAHEVAALKLRVTGHVERMIDRAGLYHRLETSREYQAV